MQTKLPEINNAELQAVRDFLVGVTDDVRIPVKPARPTQQSRPAVPVSHGISRDRIRSVRPGA